MIDLYNKILFKIRYTDVLFLLFEMCHTDVLFLLFKMCHTDVLFLLFEMCYYNKDVLFIPNNNSDLI